MGDMRSGDVTFFLSSLQVVRTALGWTSFQVQVYLSACLSAKFGLRLSGSQPKFRRQSTRRVLAKGLIRSVGRTCRRHLTEARGFVWRWYAFDSSSAATRCRVLFFITVVVYLIVAHMSKQK